MRKNNYWCYRIDKSNTNYFYSELLEGRLRQGWGYDEGQNLRNLVVNEGASRNKPMFDKVKKGDILLVPRLPKWDKVAIVEATEDWNIGYSFSIETQKGDYGHIFPAKYLKSFTRDNENVSGKLRSTLKNPSRFWNINHYSEFVEILLDTEEPELSKRQDNEDRFKNSIEMVFNELFNENEFTNKLYAKFNEQFTNAEWEDALTFGLRELFPSYQIERVGGPEEKNHGTDILIKIPSLIPGYTYAIAIQVKDYEGIVKDDVIGQICLADNYYNDESVKLIEKIVIITRADRKLNLELENNKENVKFIFANELKGLLLEIGKQFIGMN